MASPPCAHPEPGPDEEQRRRAPAARGQAHVGHGEVHQVLAPVLAADVQQGAARQAVAGEHGVHRLRGHGHAVLGIDAVGDDRDLRRGNAEQQARLGGGVLGDADDAVRAADVVAHERHVVALDLRLRHVRVLQEEQVVDGDDLLRPLGRQQQRVRASG